MRKGKENRKQGRKRGKLMLFRALSELSEIGGDIVGRTLSVMSQNTTLSTFPTAFID